MFIRLSKSKTSTNTYVYLVEGYRDQAGRPRQRVVKTYGVLEELQKEDPDILKKLKKQAQNEEGRIINVTINLSEPNDVASRPANYGYFFLEALYRQLKLDAFIKNAEGHHKYDLNEIVKMLVFGRVLWPASKRDTYHQQNNYFEPFRCKLENVYRALDVLAEQKEALQLHVHQQISNAYGRDCTLVYYDVTNYYFESEHEDELRHTGVSKEHRPNPIVQMGLLMDRNGIPIGYRLFRGNVHDKKTLRPILDEVKLTYHLGRIIVTADKGLNSGENLLAITARGDGYIVSQQIRRAKKIMIDYVLEEEGYSYNEARTFKIKSMIHQREVKLGKEVHVIPEKVICFWSKDFEARERHKRGDVEESIRKYRENPALYKASNSFGVKKYLKAKHLDTQTGEISATVSYLEFDEQKYLRDTQLDGYYMLVSSELTLTDTEIIERYHGLWRIEESFRVMKTDLEGRPVYVWKPSHIEAHFLICYLALLLLRCLQVKTDHALTAEQLQSALRSATCMPINKALFLLSKRDVLFQKIQAAFNASLDFKTVKLEQLKNYKRQIFHYTSNA